MRIEKVNENQVRCYLTRQELESRKITPGELAYGSEEAGSLFAELMDQAYAQQGFEAENMPIMIEAVPFHDGGLALIATRIDNPDELDTRFCAFAPFVQSGGSQEDPPAPSALGQLLDAIRRDLEDEDGPGKAAVPHSALEPTGTGRSRRKFPAMLLPGGKAAPPEKGDAGASAAKRDAMRAQLFTFPSLGSAADAASLAAPGFRGASALYRDSTDARYYLFLAPGPDTDPANLAGSISILSEFGKPEYITPAREQHLREHCVVVCASGAMEALAKL